MHYLISSEALRPLADTPLEVGDILAAADYETDIAELHAECRALQAPPRHEHIREHARTNSPKIVQKMLPNAAKPKGFLNFLHVPPCEPISRAASRRFKIGDDDGIAQRH